MATIDSRYNGWTNRETWAVALHVNNDEGWQESVLGELRDAVRAHEGWEREGCTDCVQGSHSEDCMTDLEALRRYSPGEAGYLIKNNVEDALNPDPTEFGGDYGYQVVSSMAAVAQDIGSLWRVNWDELGAAFLADLAEQ